MEVLWHYKEASLMALFLFISNYILKSKFSLKASKCLLIKRRDLFDFVLHTIPIIVFRQVIKLFLVV